MTRFQVIISYSSDILDGKEMYGVNYGMSVKRIHVWYMVMLQDVRRLSTRSTRELKKTIKARAEFKLCVLESKEVRNSRRNSQSRA